MQSEHRYERAHRARGPKLLRDVQALWYELHEAVGEPSEEFSCRPTVPTWSTYSLIVSISGATSGAGIAPFLSIVEAGLNLQEAG